TKSKRGIKCDELPACRYLSSLPRDYAVEVQPDFAGHHTADSFDQAVRLVVFLAAAGGFVPLHAGRDGGGRLVDDLIARIELGNDEVAGGAVGEHAEGIGVAVGLHTGKAGQEAMMQIHDAAAGVLPAGGGRENTHVPGEDHVVHLVLVAQRNEFVIVGVPL